MSALSLASDEEIRAEYARRFKKKKQETYEKIPCSIPYDGPRPKSPAQASNIRKTRAELCGCALCYSTLHPATTFAEQHRRLGRAYPPHNPGEE